jgi:ribosomal protein S11
MFFLFDLASGEVKKSFRNFGIIFKGCYKFSSRKVYGFVQKRYFFFDKAFFMMSSRKKKRILLAFNELEHLSQFFFDRLSNRIDMKKSFYAHLRKDFDTKVYFFEPSVYFRGRNFFVHYSSLFLKTIGTQFYINFWNNSLSFSSSDSGLNNLNLNLNLQRSFFFKWFFYYKFFFSDNKSFFKLNKSSKKFLKLSSFYFLFRRKLFNIVNSGRFLVGRLRNRFVQSIFKDLFFVRVFSFEKHFLNQNFLLFFNFYLRNLFIFVSFFLSNYVLFEKYFLRFLNSKCVGSFFLGSGLACSFLRHNGKFDLDFFLKFVGISYKVFEGFKKYFLKDRIYNRFVFLRQFVVPDNEKFVKLNDYFLLARTQEELRFRQLFSFRSNTFYLYLRRFGTKKGVKFFRKRFFFSILRGYFRPYVGIFFKSNYVLHQRLAQRLVPSLPLRGWLRFFIRKFKFKLFLKGSVKRLFYKANFFKNLLKVRGRNLFFLKKINFFLGNNGGFNVALFCKKKEVLNQKRNFLNFLRGISNKEKSVSYFSLLRNNFFDGRKENFVFFNDSLRFLSKFNKKYFYLKKLSFVDKKSLSLSLLNVYSGLKGKKSVDVFLRKTSRLKNILNLLKFFVGKRKYYKRNLFYPGKIFCLFRISGRLVDESFFCAYFYNKVSKIFKRAFHRARNLLYGFFFRIHPFFVGTKKVKQYKKFYFFRYRPYPLNSFFARSFYDYDPNFLVTDYNKSSFVSFDGREVCLPNFNFRRRFYFSYFFNKNARVRSLGRKMYRLCSRIYKYSFPVLKYTSDVMLLRVKLHDLQREEEKKKKKEKKKRSRVWTWIRFFGLYSSLLKRKYRYRPLVLFLGSLKQKWLFFYRNLKFFLLSFFYFGSFKESSNFVNLEVIFRLVYLFGLFSLIKLRRFFFFYNKIKSGFLTIFLRRKTMQYKLILGLRLLRSKIKKEDKENFRKFPKVGKGIIGFFRDFFFKFRSLFSFRFFNILDYFNVKNLSQLIKERAFFFLNKYSFSPMYFFKFERLEKGLFFLEKDSYCDNKVLFFERERDVTRSFGKILQCNSKIESPVTFFPILRFFLFYNKNYNSFWKWRSRLKLLNQRLRARRKKKSIKKNYNYTSRRKGKKFLMMKKKKKIRGLNCIGVINRVFFKHKRKPFVIQPRSLRSFRNAWYFPKAKGMGRFHFNVPEKEASKVIKEFIARLEPYRSGEEKKGLFLTSVLKRLRLNFLRYVLGLNGKKNVCFFSSKKEGVAVNNLKGKIIKNSKDRGNQKLGGFLRFAGRFEYDQRLKRKPFFLSERSKKGLTLKKFVFDRFFFFPRHFFFLNKDKRFIFLNFIFARLVYIKLKNDLLDLLRKKSFFLFKLFCSLSNIRKLTCFYKRKRLFFILLFFLTRRLKYRVFVKSLRFLVDFVYLGKSLKKIARFGSLSWRQVLSLLFFDQVTGFFAFLKGFLDVYGENCRLKGERKLSCRSGGDSSKSSCFLSNLVFFKVKDPLLFKGFGSSIFFKNLFSFFSVLKKFKKLEFGYNLRNYVLKKWFFFSFLPFLRFKKKRSNLNFFFFLGKKCKNSRKKKTIFFRLKRLFFQRAFFFRFGFFRCRVRRLRFKKRLKNCFFLNKLNKNLLEKFAQFSREWLLNDRFADGFIKKNFLRHLIFRLVGFKERVFFRTLFLLRNIFKFSVKCRLLYDRLFFCYLLSVLKRNRFSSFFFSSSLSNQEKRWRDVFGFFFLCCVFLFKDIVLKLLELRKARVNVRWFFLVRFFFRFFDELRRNVSNKFLKKNGNNGNGKYSSEMMMDILFFFFSLKTLSAVLSGFLGNNRTLDEFDFFFKFFYLKNKPKIANDFFFLFEFLKSSCDLFLKRFPMLSLILDKRVKFCKKLKKKVAIYSWFKGLKSEIFFSVRYNKFGGFVFSGENRKLFGSDFVMESLINKKLRKFFFFIVKTTKNNVFFTFLNRKGQLIQKGSGGMLGYAGPKRSTFMAAYDNIRNTVSRVIHKYRIRKKFNVIDKQRFLWIKNIRKLVNKKKLKKNNFFYRVEKEHKHFLASLKSFFFNVIAFVRSSPHNLLIKAVLRGLHVSGCRVLRSFNLCVRSHNGCRRKKVRRI